MADEQNSAQERTEPATPKRIEQAREKGQIARSRELATTALLLAAAVGFAVSGAGMVDGMTGIMRESFVLSSPELLYGVPPLVSLLDASVRALRGLTPFFLLVTFAALLAPLALSGWSFSAKALAFKWDKLDPVKGMQRVFSLNGLMELGKALGKFVLVTGTTVLLLWLGMDTYFAVNAEAIEPAIGHTVLLVVMGFALLAAVTIVIALIDVPFQLWNHARRLRMSKQDVKEELKETEGKPEVKSRVRALQRELAQRRMMEAVPSADVVVTNPAHYAVALRYDPEKMDAPRLVAKGADEIAARIRALASQHEVPIVTSPVLARAVYFSTKLEQAVPVGLYVAVAQVLAYVFRLREYTGYGEKPELEPDLPIPAEFRQS